MAARYSSIILVAALALPSFAQEPAKPPITAVTPSQASSDSPSSTPILDTVIDTSGSARGFLTGDKGFPKFIGYISSPTMAIDPRSLTQLIPIYDYASVGAIRPLPPGEINVIGPALSIAITERLNIGLTDGGPAITSFPGRHQGWLNIGGYAQYTLIRDVPNQFLATVGLGWTAPDGSTSLFQGKPPWDLATYATVGKEFGDFHILNTTGYKFSAGNGNVTTDNFYGTVHVDRRFFGWLYPLVEFNWAAWTKHVNLDSPFRRNIFGLDDFTANGSILTVAPGVNTVLIQDKLELGAVYQTPIASEHHIHFNSFLVKMVLRY
jgi:hypothetical protein